MTTNTDCPTRSERLSRSSFFPRLGRFFTLILYLACAPVRAQAIAPIEDTAVSWLCWMSASDMPVMRCSLEMDYHSAPMLADDDARESLELLHTRYYAGASPDELEALLTLCSAAETILTIPLYNMPFAQSWREERPQLLLHNLLCYRNSHCVVTLRPPTA